jgi:hypothetical protein
MQAATGNNDDPRTNFRRLTSSDNLTFGGNFTSTPMFILPTGHITVFAALADGQRHGSLIEESVFERDGFWTTLVDDIQMGDFATKWIVSRHDG